MAAATVTAAKSVLEMLRAAEFSQRGFILERSYADWDHEHNKSDELAIDESDKLRVDVVSHTISQTMDLSSRTSVQFTSPIDIAVRRKFGQDKQDKATGRINVEELDALMLFTQEIYVLLTKKRLKNDLQHVWEGLEIVAAPLRQHLRELHQFTGIVRVTFRNDLDLVEIS